MDSMTTAAITRSVSKAKPKLKIVIPNKNINRGEYTNLLDDEWQENTSPRDLSQLGAGESLEDWEQQALQERLSIDPRLLNQGPLEGPSNWEENVTGEIQEQAEDESAPVDVALRYTDEEWENLTRVPEEDPEETLRMQQIWDESVAEGEREVEAATAYRKKAEAQNSTTRVKKGKRTFDCSEEEAERNPNKRHQQPPPPPPSAPSPVPSSPSTSSDESDEEERAIKKSICKICKARNYKHKWGCSKGANMGKKCEICQNKHTGKCKLIRQVENRVYSMLKHSYAMIPGLSLALDDKGNVELVNWLKDQKLHKVYMSNMEKDPFWYKHYQNVPVGMEKIDGFLYVKMRTDNQVVNRLVLPTGMGIRGKTLIQEALDNTHFSLQHPGAEILRKAITDRYHFKGMSKLITEYINNCRLCAQAKPSTQLQYGLIKPLPVPTRPWTTVSMDILYIGDTWIPLRSVFPQIICSPKLRDIIICISKLLVVIDTNSGFKFLIPIPKEVDAPCIIDIWDTSIFPTVGYPHFLVTDRDPLFTSGKFQQWIFSHGIKHKLSTAYHPQTDGITERVNRDLNYILRIVKAEGKNWIRETPKIQTALNSRYDSSRKATPFQTVYGFNPKLEAPFLPYPINYQPNPLTRHSAAAENLAKAKASQAIQANKKRRPAPLLHIGDRVWLNSQNLPKKSKHDMLWIGPFNITKTFPNENNYRLDLSKWPELRGHHPVFNINLLKPYNIKDKEIFYKRPTAISEDRYEIDQIKEFRTEPSTGTHQYLVTWKEWPEETKQWVDFDQIDTEALYLFWTKGSLNATFKKRKSGKSIMNRRTRKETLDIINKEKQRVLDMMEQGNPISSLVIKITGDPHLTLLDKKFWQPEKTYQEKEIPINQKEWRKPKNPIKKRQDERVRTPLYYMGPRGMGKLF